VNTDFKYTLEFFNLLKERATIETVDGVQILVYKGAVTKLFKLMGISQSYYSKINSALKELGCISVAKRGARGVDTILYLYHEPNEMEFLILKANPLTSSPGAAKLTEQVALLDKLLGGLNVVDAVENLDRRLKDLEQNYGRLHGKAEES
jgi:hypothetical protein